jgi:N-acetylglucosaminyldiphosphoundecaprenol N-acetyl-beta-D-mannosaminyltransferase
VYPTRGSRGTIELSRAGIPLALDSRGRIRLHLLKVLDLIASSAPKTAQRAGSTECAEDAGDSPWPPRFDLFGVRVSATTYDEACDAILTAVHAGRPSVVSLHAVHAIVTSSTDPELRRKVNDFDMVGPDGQPVRWALNRLYSVGLPDRVYGPEMMLRLCARAAAEGVAVYLYGSSPAVIEALCESLPRRFPGLVIAGAESPPFRELSAQEDEAMVARINASGAGIVFIGLGCPKQDHFAFDHRGRIRGVQVCVGAAFDFHAGKKKIAPAWMQRRGLEWLFRLSQEPRRLWRRYLVTNTLFLQKFAFQWTRMKLGRLRPAKRHPADGSASLQRVSAESALNK